MKTKPKLAPETPLERHVARWIKSRASDYDGDIAAVIKDLLYGGCESGIVSHLIYTRDAVRFYRRYQREIDALPGELICLTSPSDLRNWDKSDPLAREDNNLNILAWFGFEETARRLADRAEIEI